MSHKTYNIQQSIAIKKEKIETSCQTHCEFIATREGAVVHCNKSGFYKIASYTWSKCHLSKNRKYAYNSKIW